MLARERRWVAWVLGPERPAAQKVLVGALERVSRYWYAAMCHT